MFVCEKIQYRIVIQSKGKNMYTEMYVCVCECVAISVQINEKNKSWGGREEDTTGGRGSHGQEKGNLDS